ncbi:MAG: hypothetical protein HDQ88_08230 [Clostridia bacterium]|nr:hypothetical protein [Clostridia bacterium]
MRLITEYKADNVEANMYDLEDGTYLATSTISIEVQGDRHEYYQSTPFTPEKGSEDRMVRSPMRYFKRNLIAIVLRHMDNIRNRTEDVYQEMTTTASNDFVIVDPEDV